MVLDAVKQIKTALLLLILLSLLTGIIYPLLVTLLAQIIFPWQANGSLIKQHDKVIGSALIGQYFDAPQYFWGRPSATKLFPYNAGASSGSNFGPSNPTFLNTVKTRIDDYKVYHPNQLVPVDLVTASASGLDPDISPLAALYQAGRIAKARDISETDVILLIQKHIKRRTFYILGEPRVNVLQLNLALDGIANERTVSSSR